MWKKAYSTIILPNIDTESSPTTVYIRRNFQKIENGYEYEEYLIPKEFYPFYEKEIENEGRISDLEEAVVEIFGGGM